MAAGFSGVAKGIGGLAKTVGKGVVKANKYTMGKVQQAANDASGYKPDFKGPAPKVETDVYGSTSLSTPKTQDPNSFKGRGGFAGAMKRVATGDANAGKPGSELGGFAKTEAPVKKETAKTKAKALTPPQDFDNAEFNPNWRNWKSMPSKK